MAVPAMLVFSIGGTPMPHFLCNVTRILAGPPAMRAALLLLLAFAPLACQPVAGPATDPGPPTGRQLYMERCISCHQADGSGLPGICPPLPNSPRLTGPPEDLIRILLLGMKGPVSRNGTTYRGIMPSWKFDFADGQVADVINDLYAQWNPAAPAVTGETVRRIREETSTQKLFPTAAELGLSD
jgi:mono/diheme cytochrome c family protein